MANLRALLLIAISVIIVLTGCKKDKQADIGISMQSIAGKWEVTSYILKRYHDDAFVTDTISEDLDLEYEFTTTGIITIYEEGNAETGTYSIVHEGNKYVYNNVVRGRTGASNDGAGEIEVIDKNNIRLLFSRPVELDPAHYRNVFIEVLHRK